MKREDIKLACHQCGNEFVFSRSEQEFYHDRGFSNPHYCRDCRLSRRSRLSSINCTHCGTELNEGSKVYCLKCIEDSQQEMQKKIQKSQMAANVAHTKLSASESQRLELTESLRQRELLISDLETTINDLSTDLDKAYKFTTALGELTPKLERIEVQLEMLDQLEGKLRLMEANQHKINERMLQIVQRMHELYEGSSLLDGIKRVLRQRQEEATDPSLELR